jgi:hypothetical protein
MKIAAALVLAVAAAWLWTNHRRHVTEHRLASVASELAGRPVGVRCQSFWAAMLDIQDRAGEVDFPQGRPPDHMFLTRGICTRLAAFSRSHRHRRLDCLEHVDWPRFDLAAAFADPCIRGARDDAEAVNTLAHESMHLRGFVNEAQAQCYAIQEDAWTVVRLGGSEAEGEAVARLVLALQPALPSEYQSSGCRAGGSLDLAPRTAAFPTELPPAPPPAAT